MPADPSSAGLGPELWRLLLLLLAGALLVALLAAAVAWARSRRAAGRGTPAGPVPGPPPAEPRARRFLRVSFAALWIVDGLLQAQPRMPAGFLADVREQAADAGLSGLVDPLARAWMRHPVAADAATVAVQVGLGLLLLVGRRGALGRAAAWLALCWSAVVWVLGEGFGGVLGSGASWASGAPGAVLVYAWAAVLLLLPEERWRSGSAPVLARRGAAVLLGCAAVLTALPGNAGWTADGAAGPFATGAAQQQPAVLSWPLARLAALALHHPVAVNATTVVLVAAAAVAVWGSRRTGPLVAAIALCGLTWWLAQDFGVLGGLATDPGTALPLGLLLAAALPGWRTRPEPAGTAAHTSRLRGAGVAAAAALALVLAVVVPVGLAAALPGPADASAVAADSGGGLRTIPPRPVPDFALTDQQGRPVSSAGLRGKLVLVTFLDPVCSSDCPLIAAQLAAADRRLGGLADQVEIVAIDTNPVFSSVADVAAFTDAHGMQSLANWHFVCGPPDTVQDVLARFGIAVDVPAVGMIEHSEAIYFVTPDGREAAYLDDGATEQLTTAYSSRIGDEIRSLL